MIKRIIKILSITILIIVIAIFYFSIFGIKTDKFNNQITNNILKINKKIILSLNDVNYLLNPFNLTVNIKTKNPQISLEGRNFKIKDIHTNISLKSLISDQFSIDDLKIKTYEIKLNNIIALARTFQNSPKLYALNTIIKDGYVIANINLKFDERGRIKNDYTIKGSVKKVKLNILNQFKLKDFNFNFEVEKNIYLLKQMNMKLNDIKITSQLIEVAKKKDSFFINGQFLSDKNDFDLKKCIQRGRFEKN